MSARYAPIPNPRTDPDTSAELDAAFGDSEDDDDDDVDESHPLHPHRTSSSPPPFSNSGCSFTYNFNTPVADWDQPPPGSPPPATALALPNSIGNSNGIIPTFPTVSQNTQSSWSKRLLPTRYLPHLSGLVSSARARIVGGGSDNDGVFSNVSAKPTTSGTRVQEGDSIYIVPEESSSSAPPSYAAAQADAVPPYHTSLVLLPPSSLYDASVFTGTPTQGSVIVDSLPTGTLFAFLWNTLVSTTFQFVGFVLTWVMHTTHAAKFGSRAGLGITLIQWGFALRARLDDAMNGETGTWEDGTRFAFNSTQEAEDYYNSLPLFGNGTNLPVTTQPTLGQGQSQWTSSLLTGPIATEWLSFFLMTVGWFLLLTSSLGFWRVKRWERSILASHAPNPSSSSRNHARTQSEIADEEESRRQSFFDRIGLSRYLSRHQPSEFDASTGAVSDAALLSAEDGADSDHQQGAGLPHSDPERTRRVREAFVREQRLCEDLRAAGLL